MSFIFMRAAEKWGAVEGERAGRSSSARFPLNVSDRMSPELHHFQIHEKYQRLDNCI